MQSNEGKQAEEDAEQVKVLCYACNRNNVV